MAQRYKTQVGEIDLVALKGRRLAFIEVKRRKTTEDAAWIPPGNGAASSGQPNIGSLATQTLPAMTSPSTWLLAAPFAWPRYIANAFPV